jgi:DNA modification methylase
VRDVGLGRSIVATADNVVIAGNKTLAVAQRLNIPVRVIDTDGGELIVVRRRDLQRASDVRAKELAILDNRTSELDLDWDPDVLAALKADGVPLDALWTDEEFQALLGDPTAAGQTDENSVLEPGDTDIESGDLFELGAHRLLCGDATNAAHVHTVMGTHTPVLLTTDPPYGVAYDPAWRHRAFPGQRTAVGKVLNDEGFDITPALQLFTGAIAYVWHGGLHAGAFATALEHTGLHIRAQIIWQKQHFALSRGDYHWMHEPCWYAVRKGHTSQWRGDRRQTTIWTTPNLNPMGGTRDGENAPTGHSTQKPVWLFELPMRNHTGAGDAVYDPFVGSGTTLIAAEKLNRVCIAMELDPKYVQVAVTRWEQFTGRTARRRRARRARAAR